MITGRHVAALQILALYPLPFLIVAAVVLMQRSHDRHAWVLAAMFAGFIVGSALPNLEPVMHPALRKPLVAYWALFALAAPGSGSPYDLTAATILSISSIGLGTSATSSACNAVRLARSWLNGRQRESSIWRRQAI